MKRLRLSLLTFAVSLLTFAVAFGIAACGDSEGIGDSCPGIVCNDCGASGNCDVTCSAGEEEFCGHFGFFDDPTLRCAWCE
jgi:hypothetical protein